MSRTITQESLESLSVCYTAIRRQLEWEPLFVHPAWLHTWWDCFGGENEPFLGSFRQDGETTGIAPLMRRGDTAFFMGSTDVCDYQDMVAATGCEDDFCQALLDYLIEQGIKNLELAHVRPDSVTLNHLAPAASGRGGKVTQEQEDVSVELDLPPSWDSYLEMLNTKQRHETRRKLRRLSETGAADIRFITESPGATALDEFFGLFRTSRQDKADFLTPEMETFFRRLAAAMAAAGLLRMGALEVDGRTAAMIMCFGYNNSIYLYNSGYDRDYDYLSVGLMSKVLAIKDSIEQGCRKFDFLKGAEDYKYRLGGREVPLYRCRIEIADG